MGTSPGINPITPYTTASLDYRASWIAGEMMAKTASASKNPNTSAALWGETLGNEQRAMQNSIEKPAQRTVLPPPPRVHRYLENSGLERSLSTNVPDHPTAIQVNGLRQERTEHVMCPGHVYGVNSYDTRTLCGNWAEERSDKAYVPAVKNAPTGRDWHMTTTYNDMTANLTQKARSPWHAMPTTCVRRTLASLSASGVAFWSADVPDACFALCGRCFPRKGRTR